MTLIILGGLTLAGSCVRAQAPHMKTTALGADLLNEPITVSPSDLPAVSTYPVQFLAQSNSTPNTVPVFKPTPIADFTPRRDPFAPLVPGASILKNTDGKAKVTAPGDGLTGKRIQKS